MCVWGKLPHTFTPYFKTYAVKLNSNTYINCVELSWDFIALHF